MKCLKRTVPPQCYASMALSRLPLTFVKSFRHLGLFLLGLDGARCRGRQRGRDGDAADAEDEIQFRDHVRFANAKFGVTSHRSGFSHLRSFCRRVASHISLHKMSAATGQRLLEDGHEEEWRLKRANREVRMVKQSLTAMNSLSVLHFCHCGIKMISCVT